MLSRVVSAFQRWQYRNGRPGWSARITNRLGALSFAKGMGPGAAATLEVRGHKSGRMISFPVVVADYQGQRYLVSMLGQNANWVRNLRADNHAVQFHVWPGAHSQVYWNSHWTSYLGFYASALASCRRAG